MFSILLKILLAISFAKTYGGLFDDYAYAIQQTIEGGYIVGGNTNSFGAGSKDILVLKLSSDGNVEWAKTFGKSGNDYISSIQQVIGGGYIVVGTTPYSWRGNDFWLIKLSSEGNLEWAKVYGKPSGGVDEYAYCIAQTNDIGYIVAGIKETETGEGFDILVVKLSYNGAIHWVRIYKGIDWDFAYSIKQTNDNGYIIAGYTHSFGAGNGDMLVIKLSASASCEWTKTLGGESYDIARCIQETNDGGYIVAGRTHSFGAGNGDILVIKLSPDGNLEWAKTFGGEKADFALFIEQTNDGGYIVVGGTESFGEGSEDVLIIKLSSNGSLEWAKTFGKNGIDKVFSIQQINNDYILAGTTNSTGIGYADFLIIKTEGDSMAIDCPWYDCNPIITSPNVIITSPTLSIETPLAFTSDIYPPIITLPIIQDSNICGPLKMEEVDLISNPIYLDAFPTFGKSFHVVYKIPYDTRVKLEIFDVKGSFKKILFNKNLKTGRYSIDLDLPFKNGIYFLMLKLEGKKETIIKKLIFIK
jgi:hypothetical protein